MNGDKRWARGWAQLSADVRETIPARETIVETYWTLLVWFCPVLVGSVVAYA